MNSPNTQAGFVTPRERPRECPRERSRDYVVAGACAAFVVCMVGMAYAAVPLYDWFCRSTGFGGTTQVATAAPGKVLERQIEVRFDANVMAGLPWRFEPEQTSIKVRIGDVVTVNYFIVSESVRETVGQASYNVSPPTVGAYFSKINCFCFTEQRLKPGETREMPVVFFVDPELVKDSEHDDLGTITLSYTMYPVRQPEPPRVERGVAGAPGRS
jgi:cytochrome c oxidase assembly protein subunit 11